MFGSCKHDWRVIAKTYSPPPLRLGGPSLRGPDIAAAMQQLTQMLERDSRGVTCVLLQCSKCTELRKDELWGEEPPA